MNNYVLVVCLLLSGATQATEQKGDKEADQLEKLLANNPEISTIREFLIRKEKTEQALRSETAELRQQTALMRDEVRRRDWRNNRLLANLQFAVDRVDKRMQDRENAQHMYDLHMHLIESQKSCIPGFIYGVVLVGTGFALNVLLNRFNA